MTWQVWLDCEPHQEGPCVDVLIVHERYSGAFAAARVANRAVTPVALKSTQEQTENLAIYLRATGANVRVQQDGTSRT